MLKIEIFKRGFMCKFFSKMRLLGFFFAETEQEKNFEPKLEPEKIFLQPEPNSNSEHNKLYPNTEEFSEEKKVSNFFLDRKHFFFAE